MSANNETDLRILEGVDNTPSLPSVASQVTLTGALLVGCYFAIALHGLSTHQVYRYYRMYPNDGWANKSMVGIMWILDTLHSILIMHTCYYYLIYNHFDPSKLLGGVWSLRVSITLTGIITTISHSFYSRLIYLLSGRRPWLLVTTIIIYVARLAITIAATVISFKEINLIKSTQWLSICIIISLNMVSDIMITGAALSWFLKRSKTGFESTDSIIDKLLLYAINTGLLTIVYNTAVLICAGLMRSNLVYVGMFFVISKLYTNTLLTVLNSRRTLHNLNHRGSFDRQANDRITAMRFNTFSPCDRVPVAVSTMNVGSAGIEVLTVGPDAEDTRGSIIEKRLTSLLYFQPAELDAAIEGLRAFEEVKEVKEKHFVV